MTSAIDLPQVADLIQRYEKALLPRDQRPVGYDTPDWRWQWVIHNICLFEKMDSFPPPVLYHSHKTPPDDLILRRIIITYIRMRLGERCFEPLSQVLFNSLNVVMRIAGQMERESVHGASLLDAAILARRPRGNLVPDMQDVDAWAQYFYELLFLDIRDILDDREAVINQVLVTRLPETRVAQCHLKAKVLSYWMTADEYEAWQAGNPTDIVAEMSGIFDQYMDYLRVLEDLGVGHSDDMANAIRRFYRHGDRLREQQSRSGHGVNSVQSMKESLNAVNSMIIAVDI